jgi:hypothetical protein
VVELDLEAERVALVRLEARPLRSRALAFPDLDRRRTRRKRLGASCSAMPALCRRKTNDAAEPSRIGTSSAVMSTTRLSRPSPAQAESRCSTVFTFGPSGPPSADSVVAMRVSQTLSAAALMTTGRGRSTRRKTMPESAGAGRSVSSTFWPPCTPTPTARVIDLSVR